MNILIAYSDTSFGNMSETRGIKEEAFNNRKKFLKSIGINGENVLKMSLEHTTVIKQVTRDDLLKTEDYISCDALSTKDRDVALFMVVGDCIPLFVHDKGNGAILLAHCSYKNLGLKFLDKIVSFLRTCYGTKPEDMEVTIGPSIGPCCYKGFETLKQLDDPEWAGFISRENDSYGVDLWGFTENGLIRLGVPTKQIKNKKLCTYHSGKFFSHRKFVTDGLKDDFRFATVMAIK